MASLPLLEFLLRAGAEAPGRIGAWHPETPALVRALSPESCQPRRDRLRFQVHVSRFGLSSSAPGGGSGSGSSSPTAAPLVFRLLLPIGTHDPMAFSRFRGESPREKKRNTRARSRICACLRCYLSRFSRGSEGRTPRDSQHSEVTSWLCVHKGCSRVRAGD